MTDSAQIHPLDAATRLVPAPDGGLIGQTHPAYANMVGPFGGQIAATMLAAATTHPDRLGDPLALTVNYAGPIADGSFQIDARAARTNRSTQHWIIELRQAGMVAITATAVFATRRETWAQTEIGFPDVPAAQTLPRAQAIGFAAWTRSYDMRFVRGELMIDGNEAQVGPDSITQVWISDDPPRPLDFLGLASICDAFFPRIMVLRRKRVPVSTVSITSYFHADAATLAAHGTRPVLGSARASHFGRGYHDQAAEVWSPDGVLLATSHQIVYYKE